MRVQGGGRVYSQCWKEVCPESTRFLYGLHKDKNIYGGTVEKNKSPLYGSEF